MNFPQRSAKALRAARRAREKARKAQRQLAIKLARGRLDGFDVDELAKRYMKEVRGEIIAHISGFLLYKHYFKFFSLAKTT